VVENQNQLVRAKNQFQKEKGNNLMIDKKKAKKKPKQLSGKTIGAGKVGTHMENNRANNADGRE